MAARNAEQLARHREGMRQIRSSMTPEQRAEYNEKARLRMARNYANLSADRKAEKISAGNERRKARLAAKRAALREAREAQAAQWRIENRAAFDRDAAAIYARIRRAIPRTIYADIRDDLATDIAIALLDGELAMTEIEGSVRRFMAAHLKAREWRMASLDALIPGDRDWRLTW